jgi:hypothetical protein
LESNHLANTGKQVEVWAFEQSTVTVLTTVTQNWRTDLIVLRTDPQLDHLCSSAMFEKVLEGSNRVSSEPPTVAERPKAQPLRRLCNSANGIPSSRHGRREPEMSH